MPYAPEYLHLVIPGVRFEAFLYGRNSDDWIKSGDSVEAQLAVGRTLCDKCNWRIVREFNDTDVSASRHGKKTRDDFEALLDAIVNGGVEPGVRRIVVAYNAARYYRDLEAYVRLRNACLKANALLCYNGQVYDLSKRDDLKATALHAVDAEDEAEGIRAQNLRTAATQAEAGMPHGKSQYGYTRDYKVVSGRRRCVGQHEDARGRFVFESIQRVDAGHSIRSVTRWLKSERQADRPDGVEWTDMIVRRMVMNRAYLGERQHRGVWLKAAWAPIKGLDTPEGRAMFNRVTAELTDPARRTQRGTEVSHLLTYLGVCGECGDEPWLCALPRTGGRRPAVTCESKGDVTITEEVLDAYVEEAVISWFLNKAQARAALVPEEGNVKQEVEAAQRRINAYEEQLAEARQQAEEFVEETGRFKLSASSLASLEQRLLPKLEQEQKKLQKMTGVSPLLLSLLDASDPESVWNGRPATDTQLGMLGLSLEQKREVIRQVVTVRLYKASNRGSRKLDPNRIRMSFVGEPGFRDRHSRARGSVPAPRRARGGAGSV
ncbi:recombinase family protein [Streptomyces sp. NRRL S-1022]|uniref:recombinase family protein n=1 Tax=Streptomyces sp. NRRL S-1022 TaxID=1463880 RepID=UPI0004C00806|nr:recombinase family protein [Streptomyces sp. NRRL S-1022]